MRGYGQTQALLDSISSEAELQAAVADGRLQETQNLDFKREPWPKANDEMQKDLGAMAFSGGFILLGVEERSDQPLYPFDLSGVRERVDQAAQQLSPPLVVHTREILATATGLGYLVVDVPPSAALVHFLNSGRAPWREDVITRWLSAAEARSIDADRAASEAQVSALLRQDVRLPHPRPTNVFNKEITARVIARPLFPTRRLLVGQVQDDPKNFGANGFTWTTISAADDAEASVRQSIGASAAMDLGAIFFDQVRVEPTDTGVAMHATNESASYVRAGLEADATVDCYIHNVGEHIEYKNAAITHVINDQSLVVLVRQVTRVVEAIIRATEYRGPWWFGLRLSNISDSYALSVQPSVNDPFNRSDFRGHLMRGGHYERIVPVPAAAVEAGGSAIAAELLGDLMHRMGAKSYWKASGYVG